MTTEAATKSVVIEKEFPHPPAKVWRALTEGDIIAQWLMKNDFQPKVGHAFQLRSEPVAGWDGIVEGKVLEVTPITKLVYTWGSMGMASVVTFTLTPTASGTHLHMEHAGFRADMEHAYKGATYGWQNFLGKLEKVVGEVSD
jgi:uncharacterized protein YndB with AHSA1/START domain